MIPEHRIELPGCRIVISKFKKVVADGHLRSFDFSQAFEFLLGGDISRPDLQGFADKLLCQIPLVIKAIRPAQSHKDFRIFRIQFERFLKQFNGLLGFFLPAVDPPQSDVTRNITPLQGHRLLKLGHRIIESRRLAVKRSQHRANICAVGRQPPGLFQE